MTLTVGQLAQAAGVKPTTVRYYERQGLLQEPARTSAGYRQFPSTSIARIRFIKNAQALGFSLKAIAELLALQAEASESRQTVQFQTAKQIAKIDRQIQTLEKMKRTLQDLHDRCQGPGRIEAGCEILETLSSEAMTRLLLQQDEST